MFPCVSACVLLLASLGLQSYLLSFGLTGPCQNTDPSPTFSETKAGFHGARLGSTGAAGPGPIRTPVVQLPGHVVEPKKRRRGFQLVLSPNWESLVRALQPLVWHFVALPLFATHGGSSTRRRPFSTEAAIAQGGKPWNCPPLNRDVRRHRD